MDAMLEDILSVKGLFSINGRRARLAYFCTGLALSIANGIIKNALAGHSFILFIIAVAFAWAGFCNTAKRLHDMNYSCLWAIVIAIISFIIIFAGVIFTIVTQTAGGAIVAALCGLVVNICMCFIKGTDGPNKYGPDPLAK